jgi:hypothetical protein
MGILKVVNTQMCAVDGEQATVAPQTYLIAELI